MTTRVRGVATNASCILDEAVAGFSGRGLVRLCDGIVGGGATIWVGGGVCPCLVTEPVSGESVPIWASAGSQGLLR